MKRILSAERQITLKNKFDMMKRKGSTDLPLHNGSCPSWLFERMEKLVKEICELIVLEYSPENLVEKLSDPVFFQGLGCVVGFDWHSSGLTTTLTGALKEALDEEEHGIRVTGGKGSSSRKAPSEITDSELLSSKEKESFREASKLSAKVDNSCLQDTYRLYHHCFIFSEKGEWTVIQQGMNDEMARRYHWLSEGISEFVREPHNAICCDTRNETIDLTSSDSEETKQVSLDLVNDDPSHLRRYLLPNKSQSSLCDFSEENQLPMHHEIREKDFSKKIIDNLNNAYEKQPQNFEELVSVNGIGPKSIRALALVSDLVFGSELSTEDPATYSFAHGGKDGYPYPVDRDKYDESINFLRKAISDAKVGKKQKKKSLKKLKNYL